MRLIAGLTAILLLVACASEPEPAPDPLAAYPNIPRSFGEQMLEMSCSRLAFTRDAVRNIQRLGETGARLLMVVPLRSNTQAAIFDSVANMNATGRTQTTELARKLRRGKEC
jgi:uncharacterized lipoprotein YbaY